MNGMRYRRVAVLMGGPSAEREISLRSGAAAVEALVAGGYEAAAVEVGKEGRFSLPSGTEAVFIALHGEFGEDGQVQGILDEMGVPYTGSGAEASRRAMDKVLTKQALDAHGIPTPSWCLITRGSPVDFALPAVVKPPRQGSSLGVHRVETAAQWEAALQDAFAYDETVLAETYIGGRELTVGVIGREALPLVEIEAPDGWYGYEAKYTPGRTRYLCPAPVDESIRVKAQAMSLAVFDALGATGFGRVDFRMGEDGQLFVLELNTIPGLTVTSLLPKAAAEAGISFETLCGRLMETARAGGGEA